MFKRIFDVLFSTTILIIVFPLYGLLFFLVFFIDGSPVIFLHERVGRDFKTIYIYKFRTMINTTITKSDNFDAGDKSRITKIGYILRRFKLDEIPQLFNVIKGDMSLVGPRPEVKQWVETFPEEWKQILRFKPGITDPASIIFRNEEEILSNSNNPKKTYEEMILPKKIQIYLQYVNNQSFLGDLMIILKTIRILFK